MVFGCVKELISRGSRCKQTSQINAELLQQGTQAGGGNHLQVLKSCLTLKDVIAFGIACTIGAGIFVTTGVAGKTYTGPALFLSVIIAGFCCLMNALCYSEFSSRIPAAGSAYSYTYNTMGEFAAFVMGWVLLLEYGISAAATARGFAAYIDAILRSFSLHYPPWVFQMPVLESVGPYFSLSLISPLTVLLCTVIITLGVEESSRFNRLVTTLNVVLIFFFWVSGWFFIDWNRFSPFAPNGATGVLEGAAVLFFCFIGFDSVSTLSEEVKRPQRDIPLGIIGTLACVSFLYVGTSVVLIGMVPLDSLDDTAPLAGAFAYHHCKWISMLVSLGAASTTFCTTFTCVMAQPRIFFRMAMDGLWFSVFHELEASSALPMKGIWITGVAVTIIAAIVNFDVLVRLIAAGTLLSYTVVCAGVLVVRYSHHHRRTSGDVAGCDGKVDHHHLNSRVEHQDSSQLYSPPSLFSVDADDDSVEFYSDVEDGSLMTNEPHHHPTSSQESENVDDLLKARNGEISTAALAQFAGLAGGSHLSGSLLTGPCGTEEDHSASFADLPLSSPLAANHSPLLLVAECNRDQFWSPITSSTIEEHLVERREYWFDVGVRLLTWTFAVVTLVLGYSLQGGGHILLNWSLVVICAVITLIFLIVHAFHELSLREYFLQRLARMRSRPTGPPPAVSAPYHGCERAHGNKLVTQSFGEVRTLQVVAERPPSGNESQINGEAKSGFYTGIAEGDQQNSSAPGEGHSDLMSARPRNLSTSYSTNKGGAKLPQQRELVGNWEPSSYGGGTLASGELHLNRHWFDRLNHFRCPGVPLIPLAGIFMNSYLLASLQLVTLAHTFIYLAFGSLFYVFYGAWHSRLNRETNVAPASGFCLPRQ